MNETLHGALRDEDVDQLIGQIQAKLVQNARTKHPISVGDLVAVNLWQRVKRLETQGNETAKKLKRLERRMKGEVGDVDRRGGIQGD